MITFNRQQKENGWLSCQSPHPIIMGWEPYADLGAMSEALAYRTVEHAFQALRFANPDHRLRILGFPRPAAAKQYAEAHQAEMTVTPHSFLDLANMLVCLRLKVTQHWDLRQLLAATGDEEIVLDVTRWGTAGAFWGKYRLPDGSWVGENRLGRLWAGVRGRPAVRDHRVIAYLRARCSGVTSQHKLPTVQEIAQLVGATPAEVDEILDRLGATRYEGGYISDHPVEVL